jgi:hypothetical protein
MAIVLASALLLSGFAAGCGGGASSASESSKKPPPSAEPEPFFKANGGRPGREVFKFGEEASKADREAASTVLEEEYNAREAGEWAKQCALMTYEQAEEVRETTEPDGTCASGLLIQASPLAKSRAFRVNPMTGPIEALRVGSGSAFALYRGRDGKDYATLMKKEDGKWKVDDLTPTLLPEPE